MRLPQRRSQQARQLRDDLEQSLELTDEALARLKRTLNDLEERERPKIVLDLSHALTLGDFSENAEYQDSKARLSRIDGRIFSLKDRIKRALPITKGVDAEGRIRVGSEVTVEINGKQKTFQILGTQESNPLKGKISSISPLGKTLIGKRAGDEARVTSPEGNCSLYMILEVR